MEEMGWNEWPLVVEERDTATDDRSASLKVHYSWPNGEKQAVQEEP